MGLHAPNECWLPRVLVSVRQKCRQVTNTAEVLYGRGAAARSVHVREARYVRLSCAGCGPARPGGRADLGNGLLIRFTQVRILPGAPV